MFTTHPSLSIAGLRYVCTALAAAFCLSVSAGCSSSSTEAAATKGECTPGPQCRECRGCPRGASSDVPNDSLDIVFLGDSNIWLAGDDCKSRKGWAAWFSEYMHPRTCLSMARSGASWSNTSATKANTVEVSGILGDDNVIYNQVLRLKEAVATGAQPSPSLIMIAAGGNDAWFTSKRPHEFDETVEQAFAVPDSVLLARKPSEVLSLAGAIRYNVLLLREAFPEARIIFSTSTPMAKVKPETMQRVSQITEDTGHKLGIPTIRLDNAGLIDRDAELQHRVNTYDGTHTSERGAQIVGRYMTDKVNQIIHN